MFADAALAARIEAAETALTRDASEASQRRGRLVTLVELGRGLGAFAGGSPFDKLIGLGWDPLDESALEVIEGAFAAGGAAVRAEVSTLADPAVATALTRRGYELVGFENVLGLRLDAALRARLASTLPSGVTVDATRPGELDTWIDVVATGFLSPDTVVPEHDTFAREALEQVFRQISDVPRLEHFLARRDGEIVGGASMRIHDGIAQLAGATTLPEHRRRGVQSALLRARLARAVSEGCALAVVTTDPGSRSQQNVQREGFALLYARAVLLRTVRSRPA